MAYPGLILTKLTEPRLTWPNMC